VAGNSGSISRGTRAQRQWACARRQRRNPRNRRTKWRTGGNPYQPLRLCAFAPLR